MNLSHTRTSYLICLCVGLSLLTISIRAKTGAGAGATFVVKEDGTLWAWGAGGIGQLGIGDRSNYDTPTQVGDDEWLTISSGFIHTLGIKKDGSLWTWGNDHRGELGLGQSNTSEAIPSPVDSDDKWFAVSGGNGHSLGIKEDGTLWAWGSNEHGQLGIGNQSDTSFPTQVSDDRWLAVSAGFLHSLGIKEDGTLWSWGRNLIGELGLGDQNIARNTPTQVGTDKWRMVNGGSVNSLGIREDGTLWSWGLQANSLSPSQIGSDNKWVFVVTFDFHCFGIKEDGTLWTWGSGGTGALGLGDTMLFSNVPVKVSDDRWLFVSAGLFHSVGVKEDGTVWTWGFNEGGQLGLGDEVNRTTPQLIPGFTVFLESNIFIENNIFVSITRNSGELELMFLPRANAQHRLEFSTNAQDWFLFNDHFNPIAMQLRDDVGSFRWPISSTHKMLLYRIKVIEN